MQQWTLQEVRFLSSRIKGRSYKELADMFQKRFGITRTHRCIQTKARSLGLSNGIPSGFAPGYTPWNKGLHVDTGGYRWPKGHPRYSKGKCYPVGTERQIDSAGYVEVKIRDHHHGWKFKHVWLWENANGREVPEDCCVIFADGNKHNFDLENLLLVSRQELCVMNSQGLISRDMELTKAGKAIAGIKIAIASRRRKAKA